VTQFTDVASFNRHHNSTSFFSKRRIHCPNGANAKDIVMKTKTIAALIAGSFLLLGCANSSQYPITGEAVGPNDQVRYMIAPVVTPN
jgi:hypothetical protein